MIRERFVEVDGIQTRYLHAGNRVSPSLLLLHGSGPGVSAQANWSKIIPLLEEHYEIYAPDLLGFGQTQAPSANYGRFTMDSLSNHVQRFIEKLEIGNVFVIGNSMGGALALRLALCIPEQIRSMVLMGAVGVRFPITEGLRAVWGYRPHNRTDMERIMDFFSYDKSLLTSELVDLRYQASLEPRTRESYEQMFPQHLLQDILDNMATSEEDLRRITTPTLLVHGREDQVIPVEASVQLSQIIPQAEMHIFSQCGHWTQIEKTRPFTTLSMDFFSRNS
ncbi:alpha/beta fold hydrolase [Alicyclobacillus fastidiosus]|uniref:Alpha/beta hydrolase n=1 Tax=Alicyclobacillus fastidiosus TaxID=392011 RepID=A0ABV5AJH2_9BACL|nr:alpha/beta hydrolase [Alicyclobacillus fastidiosus]WEH08375.1 alpha/beta hydrolase [Alicyclobacillus fastidiosus]